jgi:Skp family chaperone for outer membrane proteins
MNLVKRYTFPTLIALSALSVSVSAAFYSVSGLSKLFAGASFEVIIMASSLEVAKLVIASLLYRYWDQLNKLLRTYLTVAAVILVLITSMGIYGFLSAAYQETATKAGNIDSQVKLVEVKRDNIKSQLDTYTGEKESITSAITDLRSGLANNVIQYKDPETGKIITSTSSANRKALERQLDQAIERQSSINSKIDDFNSKLFEYESEIVEIKTGSELAGELGPLKYLSGLTGVPMDKIINVLLLIIIFVFDPLAISLVIAANFAFDQAKPKENLYGEIEDDFSEWDKLDNDEVLEEIDPRDLTVISPEVVVSEDWKIVDENDQELDSKKVKRILQKTPTKRRVEFEDGSTGWVDKENENKIVYM